MRRLIRKKVTCPRCGGKGRVFDKEGCIFTFGIGFIFQVLDDGLKPICPRCDGTGEVWDEMEVVELP